VYRTVTGLHAESEKLLWAEITATDSHGYDTRGYN